MSGTVRTDAERYRFLRDHCVTFSAYAEDGARFALRFEGNGLDLAAAIDAAMEPVVPAEPQAPAAAAEPDPPRDVMAEAKTREARRIILAELRKADDGRANIRVMGEVLESHGLFFARAVLMEIYLGMERDELVQIPRDPFRLSILWLTEKGARFRDEGDRLK